MRKTALSVALAATCLLAGCKQAKSDGTIAVEVGEMGYVTSCDFDMIRDTITISLSEWVDDFQIVRFDNRDEALFRLWWPLITDNHIGIRQRQGAFKLFDRHGKFLCDVGNLGQGPGEYSSLYSEAIDEKNGWVYLAPITSQGYLLKYDLQGEYLGKVELDKRLNKPKIQMLPDGNLALAHLYFSDIKSTMMVATVSPDGKVTKCPDLPKQLQTVWKNPQFGGFNHEVWHYGSTEEMRFAYSFSDTLYVYDHKTNRLKPDFVMKNYRKEENTYCIYFPIPHKYITWVKGKGSIVTDMKKGQSHFFRLKNDFVGGLSVNTNFSNGYIYAMYEPMQLMEAIEGRLAERDCTEADKRVLKELYDSLDEEDNNIMFVGRLKK